MDDTNKLNFGIGFRSFVPCRSVSIFPSKAPDAVALTVEPTEEFRFETVCGDALRIDDLLYFGTEKTSVQSYAELFKELQKDDSVQGVIIEIDSGGGHDTGEYVLGECYIRINGSKACCCLRSHDSFWRLSHVNKL